MVSDDPTGAGSAQAERVRVGSGSVNVPFLFAGTVTRSRRPSHRGWGKACPTLAVPLLTQHLCMSLLALPVDSIAHSLLRTGCSLRGSQRIHPDSGATAARCTSP